jgi:hypothetical protein
MNTEQRTNNRGEEPSDRERRIKAGYRRLLRAGFDGKAKGQRLKAKVQDRTSVECGVRGPKPEVRRLKPEGRPKSEGRRPKSEVRGSRLEVGCPEFASSASERRPAAGDYLSRFLCAGFAAVLLATAGCVGRPLKGGKATTTRNQAGLIQQTVAQGENAQQPSKQDQESIKVRTYTLPAATRIEQCAPSVAATAPVRPADKNVRAPSRSQPSTLNPQTSASPQPPTS